MKPVTFIILVVSVFTWIPLSKGKDTIDVRPTSDDVLDYTLTALCSTLIAELHEPSSSEYKRKMVARQYYATLFIIWVGTQSRPPITNVELEGRLAAFNRFSIKLKFADLIDFNDPLHWDVVSHKDSAIDSLFGSPYFHWILKQTKDETTYRKFVTEFQRLLSKDGRAEQDAAANP